MKNIWWWVFRGMVLVTVLAGGCGWGVAGTIKATLEGALSGDRTDYRLFRWCTNGLPIIGRWEEVLDGKYVVLLQNEMELRPTGGFAGSYMIVNFRRGNLSGIEVQDIYVPDGKLAGHVEPPYPVQESFLQGWWKLRDANWDPDFASAAATMAWFFEQGGERGVRGIAAVNLGVVKRFLGVIGSITVPPMGEVLNENNYYAIMQGYAEDRAFDGTRQKQILIGEVGRVVFERAKSGGWRKLAKLAKVSREELERGQILLWSRDLLVQGKLESLGWAGRLAKGWDGVSDYLYLVEANLGANKINCCVERKVEQDISSRGDRIEGRVQINWENKGGAVTTPGGRYVGGPFLTYVRVYIPERMKIGGVRVGTVELRAAVPGDFAMPNSLRRSISWGMYAVEKRDGLKGIGFWVGAKEGESAEAVVAYEDPAGMKDRWEGLVKRQPGVWSLPYRLVVNGKIVADEMLDRDRKFKANLADGG